MISQSHSVMADLAFKPGLDSRAYGLKHFAVMILNIHCTLKDKLVSFEVNQPKPNSISFIELLGLDKVTHDRYIAGCLVQSEYSISYDGVLSLGLLLALLPAMYSS